MCSNFTKGCFYGDPFLDEDQGRGVQSLIVASACPFQVNIFHFNVNEGQVDFPINFTSAFFNTRKTGKNGYRAKAHMNAGFLLVRQGIDYL